jgi:MAX-like protein X
VSSHLPTVANVAVLLCSTSVVQDLSAVSPQASGVTEFLSHSTSSQPSPVSRLFSPSTVQDSLVKGEQVSLHGGSPQVPATGSSEYSPKWGSQGLVGNKQIVLG